MTRRRLLTRPGVGVVIIAAGLTGCGSASPHPPAPAAASSAAPTSAAPTPTATATPSRRPTPRPTPTPTRPVPPVRVTTGNAVASCRPADLSVALPAISAGSGGDQSAFVEFRDVGAAPCTLSGYVSVTMVDASGHAMATQVTDDPAYPVAKVLLPPGSAPIRPGSPDQHHAYATVVFNQFNSPHGLCAADQIETPATLEIGLPGRSGTLSVSATAGDRSGKRVASCRGALRVTPVGTLNTVNGG